MRTFEDATRNLKVRHSWDVFHKQTAPYELEKLLRFIGKGGYTNSIIGRSGVGKTFFASLLMWKYEKMGYMVYHNFAMISRNPNIKHVTRLSSLTIDMAEYPMKVCNCGYEYRYNTQEKPIKGLCPKCDNKLNNAKPMVIFFDESNLTASGSKGNTKELATMKAWDANFKRKTGGGDLGACSFMIFQHKSQGAPVFRDGGVIFAEFTKTDFTTAYLDFPNDKHTHKFKIPLSALPIPIINIPLPKIKTITNGPSSFSLDYDPYKLDAYIAEKTEGNPSAENFRKHVIEFVKNDQSKSIFDISKLSKEQRLHLFKNHSYTVIEKLAIIEEILGLDIIGTAIKQKELARRWKVSPPAITQAKQNLKYYNDSIK